MSPAPDTGRTAEDEMEAEIGFAFARYLSAKDMDASPRRLVRAAVEPILEDLIAARKEIQGHEEAAADKRRLARMIDVAMHGEGGAAQQPSLCDLVGPAGDLRKRAQAAEAEAASLRLRLQEAEKGAEAMRWLPIETAPQDGTWVWGEWPEIDRGSYWRKAPRIVAPMRWISPDNVHVEHWCIGGKLTVGDDPVRWSPMLPPPPALGIDARQGRDEGSACESPTPQGGMPDPLNPNQEAGDHEPR